MVDVTSFETTKKLLEVGFPKSEDYGQYYFIVNEPETKFTFEHKIGGEITAHGDWNRIRASSATDILKVLGVDFSLYWHNTSKWCCSTCHTDYSTCLHENSAEAVAEMYLKVNSK